MRICALLIVQKISYRLPSPKIENGGELKFVMECHRGHQGDFTFLVAHLSVLGLVVYYPELNTTKARRARLLAVVDFSGKFFESDLVKIHVDTLSVSDGLSSINSLCMILLPSTSFSVCFEKTIKLCRKGLVDGRNHP